MEKLYNKQAFAITWTTVVPQAYLLSSCFKNYLMLWLLGNTRFFRLGFDKAEAKSWYTLALISNDSKDIIDTGKFFFSSHNTYYGNKASLKLHLI